MIFSKTKTIKSTFKKVVDLLYQTNNVFFDSVKVLFEGGATT
jgi:hypothetical protein